MKIRDVELFNESMVSSKQLMDDLFLFLSGTKTKMVSDFDEYETTLSLKFYNILKKYFNDRLTHEEVIELKEIVDSYNDSVVKTAIKNPFKKLANIHIQGEEVENIFTEVMDHIHLELEKLINEEIDKEQKKPTKDGGIALIEMKNKFNQLKNSKLLETLVLVQIEKYLMSFKGDEKGYGELGCYIDEIVTEIDTETNIETNKLKTNSTYCLPKIFQYDNRGTNLIYSQLSNTSTELVNFENPDNIFKENSNEGIYLDYDTKFIKASGTTNDFNTILTSLKISLLNEKEVSAAEKYYNPNVYLDSGMELFNIEIPLMEYILDYKESLTNVGDIESTGIKPSDFDESMLVRMFSTESFYNSHIASIYTQAEITSLKQSYGENGEIIFPNEKLGKAIYDKVLANNLVFTIPENLKYIISDSGKQQSDEFIGIFLDLTLDDDNKTIIPIRKDNTGEYNDKTFSLNDILVFIYNEIYSTNYGLFTKKRDNRDTIFMTKDGNKNILSSIAEMVDYHIKIRLLSKMIINYSYPETNRGHEKMSASAKEVVWQMDNQLLCPINIRGVIDSKTTTVGLQNKVSNTFVKKIYKNPFGSTETDVKLTVDEETGDERYISYNYTIFYKELNSQFRKILMSDVGDLFLTHLILKHGLERHENAGNTPTIIKPPSLLTRYEEEDLIPELQYAYRTTYPEDLIIHIKENIVYSNYYAHPLSVRKAKKHDIVGYLLGRYVTEGEEPIEERIHVGYGSTERDVLEIQNFMETHKIMRDYYYRVLLTPAMLDQEYYDEYIYMFIITWAIIKTLNNTIEITKDPDLLTDLDISNLLRSFGLSILEESKTFQQHRAWNRNIILGFTELSRWKGSKNVIDIIIKMFTDDEYDVNLFKYHLTKDLTKLSGVEKEYGFEIVIDTDDNCKITIDDDAPIKYTSDKYHTENILSLLTKTLEENEIRYNGLPIILSEAEIPDGEGYIWAQIKDTGTLNVNEPIINTLARNQSIKGKIHHQIYNPGDPIYRFTRTEYETSSIIGETLDVLNNSTEYKTFIENDDMWTLENVEVDDLLDRNVNHVITKYMEPTITENIYEKSIKAKYLFSMIDMLLLNSTGNWIGETETDEDTNIKTKPDYEGDVSQPTIDLFDKLVVEGFLDEVPKATLSQIYSMIRTKYGLLMKMNNVLNRVDSEDEPRDIFEKLSYWDNMFSGYDKSVVPYDKIRDHGFNYELFLNQEVFLKASETFTFMKDNFSLEDNDLIGLETDEYGKITNYTEKEDIVENCGYFERVYLKDSKYYRVFYLDIYPEGNNLSKLATFDGIEWVSGTKNVGDLIRKSKLFNEVSVDDNTGRDSTGYVLEMLHNLNYLLALNTKLVYYIYPFVDESDYGIDFNQNSLFNNISLSNKANMIIADLVFSKLIRFPLDYINGIYHNDYLKFSDPSTGDYFNEDIFVNKSFRDFVEGFYYDFYTTRISPYGDYKTYDSVIPKNIVVDGDTITINDDDDNIPTEKKSKSLLTPERLVESFKMIYGSESNLVSASTLKALEYLYDDIYDNVSYELGSETGPSQLTLTGFKISNTSTPSDREDVLREMSDRLLKMLESLNSLLENQVKAQVGLVLTGDSDNMLMYLIDVIKLFISYTSLLYESSYAIRYDTPSESVPYAESIKIKQHHMISETLYHDTRVTVVNSKK